MGIKRNKVLLDQSAAGTGNWFRMDTRYEVDPVRSIHGTVTAGDTLTLQATTADIRGEEDPTDTIVAADITNLQAYTADFNDVINGPWTYIRFTKTGANGTSKIQGMI